MFATSVIGDQKFFHAHRVEQFFVTPLKRGGRKKIDDGSSQINGLPCKNLQGTDSGSTQIEKIPLLNRLLLYS